MSKTPIVYHMRPPDLRGAMLLPLETLRIEHPDLYTAKMAKYRGREAIPERRVPELNCRWKNCVQFSTVHPAAIRDAMLRTGHTWPKGGARFFLLDARVCAFTADNTIIWLYEDTAPTADFAAAQTDVIRYSTDCIVRLSMLGRRTERYFRQMRDAKRRPLLFVGVPHLLHRGTVPLDHAEEIVV